MKDLDFKPHKSTKDFRKNYRLHDEAEAAGKNLLIQWGVRFEEFGKDKRFEKVWEKGEDKPDLLLSYKGKKALLDWKGKHKGIWLVNKRAVESYKGWAKIMGMPVLICFTVFDSEKNLTEMRIASLEAHNFIVSSQKEWDKNETVEFEKVLPVFSKAALINLMR